jgi:ribosome-binding protein aMBF1 (putative translation factor)
VGPRTETAEQATQIFNFPAPREEAAPQGFRSIDEVVSKYEADPKRAFALAQARSRVAQKHYGIAPLTQLRLAKGISQAKLATMIKSSQAHIARVESGQDVVIGTLERIADALAVDAEMVIQAYRQQRDTKNR